MFSGSPEPHEGWQEPAFLGPHLAASAGPLRLRRVPAPPARCLVPGCWHSWLLPGGRQVWDLWGGPSCCAPLAGASEPGDRRQLGAPA